MADINIPREARDRAAAELAEWSTFRAVAPIYHDGTIAYMPGHMVPASNVAAYKYDEQGLVEKLKKDEQQSAQEAHPNVVAGPDGTAVYDVAPAEAQ